MAQISLTFDQNRTFEFIVIARGVGRIGGGDGGVGGQYSSEEVLLVSLETNKLK